MQRGKLEEPILGKLGASPKRSLSFCSGREFLDGFAWPEGPERLVHALAAAPGTILLRFRFRGRRTGAGAGVQRKKGAVPSLSPMDGVGEPLPGRTLTWPGSAAGRRRSSAAAWWWPACSSASPLGGASAGRGSRHGQPDGSEHCLLPPQLKAG